MNCPIDFDIVEQVWDNVRDNSLGELTTKKRDVEDAFHRLRNQLLLYGEATHFDEAARSQQLFILSLAVHRFVSRAMMFYLNLKTVRAFTEHELALRNQLEALLRQAAEITRSLQPCD